MECLLLTHSTIFGKFPWRYCNVLLTSLIYPHEVFFLYEIVPVPFLLIRFFSLKLSLCWVRASLLIVQVKFPSNFNSTRSCTFLEAISSIWTTILWRKTIVGKHCIVLSYYRTCIKCHINRITIKFAIFCFLLFFIDSSSLIHRDSTICLQDVILLTLTFRSYRMTQKFSFIKAFSLYNDSLV